MILRRDVYSIRETGNKLARFWVKIPVHGVRGGVKVPIKVADMHEELLRTCSIREGKLIWKGDHWSFEKYRPISLTPPCNYSKRPRCEQGRSHGPTIRKLMCP